MYALYRLPEFGDQSLSLARVELDRTRQLRHLDTRPRNSVPSTQIGTLLRFRGTLNSRGLFERDLVESGDLVQNLQGLPRFVPNFLFGQLLFIELHDLFDGAGAVAQFVCNSQQLLDNDRRARDGLQDEKLAPLDALGEDDFAFACEQRNNGQLPQIDADRVVRFLEEPGLQVHLRLLPDAALRLYFYLRFEGFGTFQRRTGSLHGGNIFVTVDAVALEGRELIVNFFQRLTDWQDVVHLVIELRYRHYSSPARPDDKWGLGQASPALHPRHPQQ